MHKCMDLFKQIYCNELQKSDIDTVNNLYLYNSWKLPFCFLKSIIDFSVAVAKFRSSEHSENKEVGLDRPVSNI